MKRDERLRGLSSDHHHALVLARTIRRRYLASSGGSALLDQVRRAFEEELAPHFEIEEKILLPALDLCGEGALAERTRREHAELREHLEAAEAGESVRILRFAVALEEHVRFEERILFPTCEGSLADEILEAVRTAKRP